MTTLDEPDEDLDTTPTDTTDESVDADTPDEPGADEPGADEPGADEPGADVVDAAGPAEPAPTEEAPVLAVPAVATGSARRRRREEVKASARKVRRVIRRVDPWSVFKVASLFIAALWGIVVLASLLIWRAAVASGSIENTEDFIRDLGFDDFNFDPQQMFESLLSAGAVVAVAAVFFTVLLAVLFNLVCDITGGVRITMIEQDLADRTDD